ncbi:hypothetical protein QLX08_004359 [Tetragonisca angustula]|uniref:Uncharacterized protein n=1 Tax=Tetragonisca angustula TaxID=166442 RepID=A0AAW1A4J3_9HYME
MKEGNISIHKINNNDNKIPDVFRIEIEPEIEELDLSRITDPKHKQTIKELVQNYKPKKSREIGIKMSLILQDDIPVYKRRRSSQKKATQIESWLLNGIIQPSHSDYTSPVVLVKKKDDSTRICVDSVK